MNDGTEMAPERIDIGGNAPEETPSFTDFFGEAPSVGGAWPKGWYGAVVIEGYATGNGHTFTTEDKPSKAGDSRNLVLCLTLDGGKLGTRNTFTQLNYRADDFTVARMKAVKDAREHFAGTSGKWIGNEDLQRSSLAIASLHQLESALGFTLPKHPAGHVNAYKLVSQKLDIRLGMDKEDKYNEVNAFAKAGTRAKK